MRWKDRSTVHTTSGSGRGHRLQTVETQFPRMVAAQYQPAKLDNLRAATIMRLKFIRRRGWENSQAIAPIVRKRSAGLIGARGFRRRQLRYSSCASRQLLVASNDSEHDAFSVTILHLVGNRLGVRSLSEPVVQRQHHSALIHYKLSLRVVLYSVFTGFLRGGGGSHQGFGGSPAHAVPPGKFVQAFPTRPVCRGNSQSRHDFCGMRCSCYVGLARAAC